MKKEETKKATMKYIKDFYWHTIPEKILEEIVNDFCKKNTVVAKMIYKLCKAMVCYQRDDDYDIAYSGAIYVPFEPQEIALLNVNDFTYSVSTRTYGVAGKQYMLDRPYKKQDPLYYLEPKEAKKILKVLLMMDFAGYDFPRDWKNYKPPTT